MQTFPIINCALLPKTRQYIWAIYQYMECICVSGQPDNSNVFQMTCYAQVPAGYDGVVLAFCHGSIDIDGMHLHEVEDKKLLLCRLA